MKNAIIIFLLFTLCGQTYAQSIVDFFYSIPAEYLDNLSYVERKHLIEGESLTKDDLKHMGFTIELPRKGKDIRISFNPINETYFNREYSKYLKYRSKTYRFDKAKELFDPEF